MRSEPATGTTAIHAELGTAADFRRLIAAAGEHGLEIALDFAIQCSPDHPWLAEHPEWSGTAPTAPIRYAENPPRSTKTSSRSTSTPRVPCPTCGCAARRGAALGRRGRSHLPRRQPAHQAAAVLEWMIADIRAAIPT